MTDPGAELLATLAAFNESPSPDPNRHAACRFPARLLWLKQKLGNQFPSRTDIHCPELDTWTRSRSVSSLSVIYATGFLGNPASYYGHTLIKFNFKDSPDRQRLMDVSVNYGAILENSRDNMLAYLIKCLVGGYDGGFSHINFYFHEHNYGDVELRDLWEYQLDLPQDTVDLIVAHAWEVLGKRYTYYFFRHNCAYRMAELLEVAEGLRVIPDSPPWMIPQSMIQTLGHAQYQGKNILAKEIYHPSRQSRFYEKYRNLSPDEIAVLEDLVNSKATFADEHFQQMPLTAKHATLDTMLDYYQFVGSPIDDAAPEIRQAYARTLTQRYQLAPGIVPLRPGQPLSPQEGYPPGWGQIGWRNNSMTGDALSVRIRPAYYDVLDTDSSHILNAALSMFDLCINLKRGRAYLDRFDLVNIENVSPGLSRLPGDDGKAWKLRFGAEQARLWCDTCPVVRVQGDKGYGRQWTQELFAALYVGGALQSLTAEQGWAYAKASAALTLQPGKDVGIHLEYEQRYAFGGQERRYDIISTELRWAIGSHSDLRINYGEDRARLLGIGYGIYW